jgi:hypothetical protein
MNFEARDVVDLHIIDALDSNDARNGRSEALAIRYHLRHTSISIVSHYAWDQATLMHAIKRIAFYRKAYINPRKYLPFLHVACHGLPDGLIIGDDVPVPWSKLVQLLLPLQHQIDYTLPLTLSSCHGFSGYRLALQELKDFKKKRPYYLLIGPQAGLSTQELILSTSELYRGLLEDHIGLPASIERANNYIKKPVAYLAYTYGTDVINKFERRGIDDRSLFRPSSRRASLL